MSNYLLAWINNVIPSTLAVSSFAPGLNVTQLLNDQGNAATAWQTSDASTNTLTFTSPSGSKWRVFGLFRTNLTVNATCAVVVRNGGSGGTIVFSGSMSHVVPGYGQMICLAPAEVTGDWCQFTISDAANPDHFFNIPLVYAGTAFQSLTDTVSSSSTQQRVGQLTKKTTRAGGVYVRPDWSARSYTFQLDVVRSSNDIQNILALELALQQGINVLFIPDPSLATIGQDAVFGIVDPQSPIGYASYNTRSWRATITERL